jgi:hypothetical protein
MSVAKDPINPIPQKYRVETHKGELIFTKEGGV